MKKKLASNIEKERAGMKNYSVNTEDLLKSRRVMKNVHHSEAIYVRCDVPFMCFKWQNAILVVTTPAVKYKILA